MPARSCTAGTFGFGMSRTALPPRTWTTIQARGGSVSAGSGTPVSFFIIGPNDGGGAGWCAVKSFFATETVINFTIVWSTSDGISFDWPFALTTPSEPFSYSNPAKIASTNSESGSRSVTVPAGWWVTIGCYASDSCCGPGQCTFSGLPAV
jgi:hypothetical protein